MLYTLRINQKMSFDENISINAVIVFEAMYQLSRLSYATIKVMSHLQISKYNHNLCRIEF